MRTRTSQKKKIHRTLIGIKNTHLNEPLTTIRYPNTCHSRPTKQEKKRSRHREGEQNAACFILLIWFPSARRKRTTTMAGSHSIHPPTSILSSTAALEARVSKTVERNSDLRNNIHRSISANQHKPHSNHGSHSIEHSHHGS